MRYTLLLSLLSLLALLPTPRETRGCAAVPRPGGWVGVNSEEAIIVYDAATRTEHFIRRADFRTETKEFGFLVPTPTQPELGEADAWAFSRLAAATAPRRVFSGKVNRIVLKERRETAGMPAHAAPHILDRKQVAGYDAVVLQAEDTEG